VDIHDRIINQLVKLNVLAKEHGIQLLVDDEFGDLGSLAEVKDSETFRVRRLKRLDQVVRLSPNGTCSVGKEILQRADSGVPTWYPYAEQVEKFIGRVLAPRLCTIPAHSLLAE
jgi:hypothetical protein